MIREYKEKDLDELLDAWLSASKVAHPFLGEEFFEQERKNISSIYLPKAETWVYERKGVVVGFRALIGNEVGGIFVDAGYQRKGIGKELMDNARSIRAVLELDVFKDNNIGREFYKKQGFTEMNEHTHEETGHALLRLKLVC